MDFSGTSVQAQLLNGLNAETLRLVGVACLPVHTGLLYLLSALAASSAGCIVMPNLDLMALSPNVDCIVPEQWASYATIGLQRARAKGQGKVVSLLSLQSESHQGSRQK